MTGRTISEFITELYNNPEMEFIYHDNRYMISGYVELPMRYILWNFGI